MQMNFKLCGLLLCVFAGAFQAWTALDFAEPIRVIRAVGPEGSGNIEAARAWRELASAKAAALPSILAGMDSANDLAANWLRAAVETIAGRELNAGGNLPLAELGQFLQEQRHHPRARRLAFELVVRVDPATADRLLTGMVNDPSPELRHDAVQKLIQQAAQTLSEGKKPGATLLFQQALALARDVDQINGLAKNLRALDQTVDLPKVFGFVMQWKVIGPFDSAGGKGFAAVYPPEEKIDFAAEYDGKSGRVRWKDFVSADEYGVASMNRPFGALKGAAAYACAEFYSDRAQSVELRLGSENAFKVWLNGQFLFGQDEYHRNKAIDQYRMNAQLRPGRNLILVKVCQNEQTEDWAAGWDFQQGAASGSRSFVR
jgi:hypothetical protein